MQGSPVLSPNSVEGKRQDKEVQSPNSVEGKRQDKEVRMGQEQGRVKNMHKTYGHHFMSSCLA